VTYHVPYVGGFLQRAFNERLGLDFQPQWVDMAWLMPAMFEEQGHTVMPLDHWLECFGLYGGEGRRDAMANTLLLGRIFQMLLVRAVGKQIDTAARLVDESRASSFAPYPLALRMSRSLTRLQRYYLYYTGGFLAFIGALAVLEQHGMPPRWVGYAFLIFTISMYAGIGIISRTSDVSEYYVAGRRVPAFFNGMATGADWMSARPSSAWPERSIYRVFRGWPMSSGGPAVSCWSPCCWHPICGAASSTPFRISLGALRRQRHPPGCRGGSHPRLLRLCRGTDLRRWRDYQSFRQPAVRDRGFRRPGRHSGLFLSRRHAGGNLDAGGAIPDPDRCLHHPGRDPVLQRYRQPGTATGLWRVLQKVTQLEDRLFDSPAEIEVRQLFRERADLYAQKIMQLPQSLSLEREQLSSQINRLKASDVQMRDIVALERQRRDLPHDPEQAKARWRLRCSRRPSGAGSPFTMPRLSPAIPRKSVIFSASIFWR
jgi:hypothetical protein